MKKFMRILSAFFVLLLSSLPIVAMDDNEEKFPSSVPSLKTLCLQRIQSNIQGQFERGEDKGVNAITKCGSEDIENLVFSQAFSVPPLMFSDSCIYKPAQIRSYSAPLTNISLRKRKLEDILKRQSSAPQRLMALLHSTMLTSLDLGENSLEQHIFDFLKPLSGLRKLNLEENSLNNFNLETFLNLTDLNLRRNALRRLPSYQDHYFPQPINFSLTHLDVSENPKISFDEDDLKHLTTLVNLNLSFCKLSKINALSVLTNLQTLNVEKNFLRGGFGVFSILTNLTSLNVGNQQNSITDEDCLVLRSLKEKGKVTILLMRSAEGKNIIIGPHPELFDTNTQ